MMSGGVKHTCSSNRACSEPADKTETIEPVGGQACTCDLSHPFHATHMPALLLPCIALNTRALPYLIPITTHVINHFGRKPEIPRT